MSALREVGGALTEVLVDNPVVALLIGIVGLGVEGVLQVFAELRKLQKARIGDGLRLLAFRVVVAQELEIVLLCLLVVAAQGQQEEVVIDIVHLPEVGELVDQSRERSLGQREVADTIHFQDAAVVEAVKNQLVRELHLFLRKRYLLEVELALVRVVLQRVAELLLLLAELAIFSHFIS